MAIPTVLPDVMCLECNHRSGVRAYLEGASLLQYQCPNCGRNNVYRAEVVATEAVDEPLESPVEPAPKAVAVPHRNPVGRPRRH